MDSASWSTREKLAIVSFVKSLGDNEWVDADKFFETFCEVGRPENWLAATSCAHQIKDLLQNTPEKYEDILEIITKARIAELEELASKQHDECTHTLDELKLIESGSLDKDLDKLLEKVGCCTSKAQDRQLVKDHDSSNDTPQQELSKDVPACNARDARESNRETGVQIGPKDALFTRKDVLEFAAGVAAERSFGQLCQRREVPEASEISTTSRSDRKESNISTQANSEVSICDTSGLDGHSLILDWMSESKDSRNSKSQVSAGPSAESLNLTNSSCQSYSSIDEYLSSSMQGCDASVTSQDKSIGLSDSTTADSIHQTSGPVCESRGANRSIDDETACLSSTVPHSDCDVKNSETENDMGAAAYKAWKKSTMILWNQISSHRYANLFMQPVTDEMAPDYSSTVYRAVDLASIKRDIENGTMRTTSEFHRDLMLMFENALMYNDDDDHVYKMASQMRFEVMAQVAQFFISQILTGRVSHASNTEEAAFSGSVVSASKYALLNVLVEEARPKRSTYSRRK